MASKLDDDERTNAVGLFNTARSYWRSLYRTRDEAKADVFDYIECFYNAKRRHSTIGYISPMEFEAQAGLT